jgi:hypothetical protein
MIGYDIRRTHLWAVVLNRNLKVAIGVFMGMQMGKGTLDIDTKLLREQSLLICKKRIVSMLTHSLVNQL